MKSAKFRGRLSWQKSKSEKLEMESSKLVNKVKLRLVLRFGAAVFLWAAILFFGYLLLRGVWRQLPLGSFDAKKGEVIGESTNEAKIESGQVATSGSPKASGQSEKKAVATPAASSLPQFILVNEKTESSKTEAAKEEPKGPEKQEILPYLKEYKEGGFNLARGTLKFSVIANWAYETDEVLLLLNFNGQDFRNLFRIVGSNNTIIFDTFDRDGESLTNDLNYYVGEEKDYKGTIYDIKFTWDFTVDPVIKRLYVNGNFVADSFPETVPTDANPFIYFGNITGLVVTDEWEAP